MDNPCRMSSGQRARTLNGDVEHFAELHWCVPHSFAQSFAIDELGGDKVHRVDLLDLVNRDDVGMIQRGSSLCFLNKAPHPRLISNDIGRQDLQRYFTIELCILCEIYLAHSALA